METIGMGYKARRERAELAHLAYDPSNSFDIFLQHHERIELQSNCGDVQLACKLSGGPAPLWLALFSIEWAFISELASPRRGSSWPDELAEDFLSKRGVHRDLSAQRWASIVRQQFKSRIVRRYPRERHKMSVDHLDSMVAKLEDLTKLYADSPVRHARIPPRPGGTNLEERFIVKLLTFLNGPAGAQSQSEMLGKAVQTFLVGERESAERLLDEIDELNAVDGTKLSHEFSTLWESFLLATLRNTYRERVYRARSMSEKIEFLLDWRPAASRNHLWGTLDRKLMKQGWSNERITRMLDAANDAFGYTRRMTSLEQGYERAMQEIPSEGRESLQEDIDEFLRSNFGSDAQASRAPSFVPLPPAPLFLDVQMSEDRDLDEVGSMPPRLHAKLSRMRYQASQQSKRKRKRR